MLDDKDRQFMLSLGKRLGQIEEDLRGIKGAKTPALPSVPNIKPLVGSKAANKFFGVKSSPSESEPECTANVTFKDSPEMINKEVIAEVANGQKMLRKAVLEFCEEFDIQEFNINYTDPTPKKDKPI